MAKKMFTVFVKTFTQFTLTKKIANSEVFAFRSNFIEHLLITLLVFLSLALKLRNRTLIKLLKLTSIKCIANSLH